MIGGEQYEPDEENPMIGFRGCGRYTDPFFEECFAMELEAQSLNHGSLSKIEQYAATKFGVLFRCTMGNNHHTYR